MGVYGRGMLKVALGVCNTYLIRGKDGYLLVDAGNSGREEVLFRFLKENSISPRDIRLIVITHAHYDHVGSLYAIRTRCECPVMVHQKEAQILEKGEIAIPPGTFAYTKMVSWIGKNASGLPGYRSLLGFKAVRPDLVIGADTSLEEYGFDGTVMHTPGHTEGSVTVLLSGGEAFCGDLAMNYFPFGMGPIFPAFAGDVEMLYRSWATLLRAGAATFYPAHGEPFSSDRLKKKLMQRNLSPVAISGSIW